MLPKPEKRLLGSRSLSRMLIPITLKLQTDIRSNIHHSQKHLDVITSSNFIIKKHKPFTKPWTAWVNMHQDKTTDQIIYRPKIQSISPIKLKPSPIKRKIIINIRPRTNNISAQTPLKTRNNSISGWA